MIIVICIASVSISWLAAKHLPRLFPKFKPGTPVCFDGDCTGLYVRRTTIGDYHRVKVTGPAWYSAARTGREVTVHGRRDALMAEKVA